MPLIWYSPVPVPTPLAPVQGGLWFGCLALFLLAVVLLVRAFARTSRADFPPRLRACERYGIRFALALLALLGLFVFAADLSRPQPLQLRVVGWLVALLLLGALVLLVAQRILTPGPAQQPRCAACGYLLANAPGRVAQQEQSAASEPGYQRAAGDSNEQRAPREQSKSSEDTPSFGSAAGVCSECGVDLARVGVIPAGVRAAPALTVATCWSFRLAWGAAALAGFAVFALLFPMPEMRAFRSTAESMSSAAADAKPLRSELASIEYEAGPRKRVLTDVWEVEGAPTLRFYQLEPLGPSNSLLARGTQMRVSGPPEIPTVSFAVRRLAVGGPLEVRRNGEWFVPHLENFVPHFEAAWPAALARPGAVLAARHVHLYEVMLRSPDAEPTELPTPPMPEQFDTMTMFQDAHHAVVLPGPWWWGPHLVFSLGGAGWVILLQRGSAAPSARAPGPGRARPQT